MFSPDIVSCLFGKTLCQPWPCSEAHYICFKLLVSWKWASQCLPFSWSLTFHIGSISRQLWKYIEWPLQEVWKFILTAAGLIFSTLPAVTGLSSSTTFFKHGFHTWWVWNEPIYEILPPFSTHVCHSWSISVELAFSFRTMWNVG